MLSLLNLYKYIILFEFFFFFFKYSSDLAPLKKKIKSVLNKLKVYKKISCTIFFFWLFIFVLLLFGPILKYRKNKSAHMSL